MNHFQFPTAAVVSIVLASIAILISRQRSGAMSDDNLSQGARFWTPTPREWYRLPAAAVVVALPFVQWFGYLRFGSPWAVLLPLAAACLLFAGIGIFRPAALPKARVDWKEHALGRGIAVGILTLLLIAPSNGMVMILQGVMIDVVGLMITGSIVMLFGRQGHNTRSKT